MKPLHIAGMSGLGDNLHQRAIIRELMQSREVWLSTPWPSVYHDLVGPALKLIDNRTQLRTQAKNAKREAALFTAERMPPGVETRKIHYMPAAVRQHRGVLQAMIASCGVSNQDFRLPVPDDWHHGLNLPEDRPVLVYRPLIERKEWTGCRNRNTDLLSWMALTDSIREKFFVVSVADLEEGKEWLAQPQIDADITLHKGELDFRGLAALWADADAVMSSPGFGVILAQSVSTPAIAVFGGYEGGYSFTAGAAYTPTCVIQPISPCDCFSHTHDCKKTINLEDAIERLGSFVDANCT